ncbi:MAG: hypothetical protein HQ519_00565, partial [Planctomycetes bacterium]|nr:hypothetical protein [Planctomycetota bacterium]
FKLHWKVPDGLICKLPVEIVVGGVPKKFAMPGGRAAVAVPNGVAVVVDPFDRILRVGNVGTR